MKGLLECSYHKPSSPIIMHKLNHCSENKLPIKKGNKFLILMSNQVDISTYIQRCRKLINQKKSTLTVYYDKKLKIKV